MSLIGSLKNIRTREEDHATAFGPHSIDFTMLAKRVWGMNPRIKEKGIRGKQDLLLQVVRGVVVITSTRRGLNLNLYVCPQGQYQCLAINAMDNNFTPFCIMAITCLKISLSSREGAWRTLRKILYPFFFGMREIENSSGNDVKQSYNTIYCVQLLGYKN